MGLPIDRLIGVRLSDLDGVVVRNMERLPIIVANVRPGWVSQMQSSGREGEDPFGGETRIAIKLVVDPLAHQHRGYSLQPRRIRHALVEVQTDQFAVINHISADGAVIRHARAAEIELLPTLR
ncbi:MAG: hypothetical protein BWZ07_02213 [Alphaproteobacteria bacterium ADurb.BinA280]|nr:MAG: hypothetical protein BWZ07_02213 [Alphaproteobacteria bacterium ADurb.BinA280]